MLCRVLVHPTKPLCFLNDLSYGGGDYRGHKHECGERYPAVFPNPIRKIAQADLWACVEEAGCHINVDSLQLAVMRDPRPVTVSSYFQLRHQHSTWVDQDGEVLQSVDEYFRGNLPIVCKWVSIRYLLFTELLANTSAVFWYDDAVADPVDWHDRYYSFVGINMPREVVNTAAREASRGGSILGFHSKGLDKHPGGIKPSVTRSYRDELSRDSLTDMDDVLRLWLPPVVLEILGLAP